MNPSTVKRLRKVNPELAVAYLRVSTAEQSLGVDAQQTRVRRLADAEGLTIVSWHIDQGVSGVTPVDERPGLVDAFQSLQEHRAGVLIAAHRDRLARDVVVAATIQRLAIAYGVQLLTADGAGKGQTPEETFMRTLMDAMAAYERALAQSRTSSALRAKRRRGERAGGVPFGYYADPTGKLLLHKGEQKVIALIRDMTARGFTVRAIAGRLEMMGIKPRGKRWYPTTIHRIQREVMHGQTDQAGSDA